MTTHQHIPSERRERFNELPMSMIPFHSRYGAVALRDVRAMIVDENECQMPAGRYLFVESYCDDPACDCRRVFLQVLSHAEKERMLLGINYGWESPKYYQKYLHWSAKKAREISAGCLDPLSPRPDWAATFLQLFRENVLDDFYKTRLKQHYTLFKLSLTRN